uniref:Disease resistance R13L4/SHOC-2-like LRR domain-containing protein n=2 Tax=Oryza brachyantha TaxID=4533 RepID=J3MWF9_ORYBR
MAVARRHRVDRLSEDDGWMLLHRMANLHAAAGGFEDIGRKIVQKCSGLPVALRWIGNDLRERTDQNIWEKVYECDFFGKYSQIHSCIDASYKRLSFVLKRCFLYCLLYPEESVIQKQCIVQQWIAEGFFSLAASQEGEAERCYEALIDRCLLLPEDNGHGEPGAKMPKLFRLFAIHKSQHENYVNNPRDIRTIFKPWRLSITSGYSVQDIPDEATSLRSLFLFGSPLNNGTALEFIFNKLTSLRVLDLRDTQVDTISNNLERLRQLRYLNLSGTRIQSLPESIGNLTVLQFLILKNCTRLESLPRRVGRLRKLRSLDISGTPKLNGVRFNLEQLTQLNCLQGFIPATSAPGNNGNGWKFEDLRHLGNLTSLQMVKLDTALSTTEDQNQLILDGQPHLRELELIWCRCSPADPQSRNRELETRVFGKLKPAGCLVSLKIVNYCGNGFASWLSSSYLTELQRLILDGCLPSLDLPTLGQMINLKFLAITASNINQPPREERNDVAFPQLEQLILGRMESLQAWSGLQERDLPMLRVFQLDGCQRELTSIPSWLQSCRELTSMKIQNAGTLQEIADLPSLKELEVHNCSRLERISNIIRLDDLKIFNCSGLEAVNDVPFLCSVHLELQGAQLPRWLQPFNLRRLDITGTQELLNICSSPFSPCWSIIQGVADHVCGKKLGDDSIHFSYNKSTGSLYTSPRCAQRIAVPGLHNSATVRQDNWRAWKHNTFYAILLIATCSLVYLANF